jgi:hypothetical protein
MHHALSEYRRGPRHWDQPQLTLSLFISMVLVHGLAGDGISTWKHEDGTFWPSQLDRIPDTLKEPRVLVFQYLTRFSRPFQSRSISSQSEKLLQQLSQLRGDAPTRLRPIIFIGHNTGGIIIKEVDLWSRLPTYPYYVVICI